MAWLLASSIPRAWCLSFKGKDFKRYPFDRSAGIVEHLALVADRIDRPMGVPKEDLLGPCLWSLLRPFQVAGDLIENFLIRVDDMRNDTVDTCLDDSIVEKVLHGSRSRSMLVSHPPCIEQLMEVGIQGDLCIDDIAVEKDGAV